MSRFRLFPIGLLVLPLLTGCVPNKLYRPGAQAVELAPIVSGQITPSTFKLAMVEFDDMGESWEKCTSLTVPEKCQLTRAVDLIRREKKQTGEVVVVVFIHGWKNNASPANEEKKNLHDFKVLMDRLSREEPGFSARRKGPAAVAPPLRSYVGVYMAWRGQSVAGDLFSTFWNRRDAAQRVGSSDFAEALFRIMSATKEQSPNSRIVVVGHSFGARVLENALTNTFVSLLVPQPDGTGTVKPPDLLSPADLILYVNPATDSFRTKQMVELMKRTDFDVQRGARSFKGPLFLSVTSTGDTATGTAFPLGQGLSAVRKSFRQSYNDPAPNEPSQKFFFSRTPGHVPFLFSHSVTPASGACISHDDSLRFTVREQCYEMAPVLGRWNDSPYWVMTVPPAIIKDHVDIFNPGFTTMVIDLMKRYEVLDSPQATVMVRAQ